MKLMKRKSILFLCIALFIILIFITAFIIHKSFATPLENDVEVKANSLLTYYLDIKGDGVDKFGVKSSDSNISSIRSGVVTITDKIPSGLTFTGFVTTEDGTIGAVQRGNNLISCPGKVIDDTHEESLTEGKWNTSNTEYTYHGLHYNKNTNTVSFKVDQLMSGCVLTVGIKTQTPSTIDDPDTTVVEKRRDFYNFGEFKENTVNGKSNTVHVYMGDDSETSYNVTYQFEGDVPTGLEVPSTQTYTEGSSVTIASNPDILGYTFGGWSSNDVTISNGTFTMPNSNVVIKGSFTSKEKKSVTYNITGDTPSGYVLPSVKTYNDGEIVNVDSLKVGDIINGYKFLGWTSSDVTISDGLFTMPNSNVTITGSFEEVKYNVIYKFYDTVKPSDSDSLLPEVKSYKPGVTVKLESNPTASGYKFLGWYHDDNFEMPEEDVIIYGEWKEEAGTFRPSISKEVVSKKNNYKTGDEIEFKITVTNNASFSIKDVYIKEEGGVFESKDNYTVVLDHMAKINSISSGGSTVLYAKYTVANSDIGSKKNTALIKGALADNNYVLEDREYKAEASYDVGSNIIVTNTVRGNMANINEYFKVKVSIDCNSPDTYSISGQDSTVTYNGTSVNTSSTYTCGSDNYIYLKHGQSVVIGNGSNDNIIPIGTTYSVTEDDNDYKTYINESTSDNKSSGNLSINDKSVNNTVSIVNEYSSGIDTGLDYKNIPYLIVVLIPLVIVIYIIVRKKIK